MGSAAWKASERKLRSARQVRPVRQSPLRGIGDRTVGCVVRTSYRHRQRLYDAVVAWARYCDRLFVFSDESFAFPTEDGLGFISVEIHATPWVTARWQENRWGRLLANSAFLEKAWCPGKFSYFPDSSRVPPPEGCVDMDYVLLCSDDAFVVMENLREFLSQTEIDTRYVAPTSEFDRTFFH